MINRDGKGRNELEVSCLRLKTPVNVRETEKLKAVSLITSQYFFKTFFQFLTTSLACLPNLEMLNTILKFNC